MGRDFLSIMINSFIKINLNNSANFDRIKKYNKLTYSKNGTSIKALVTKKQGDHIFYASHRTKNEEGQKSISTGLFFKENGGIKFLPYEQDYENDNTFPEIYQRLNKKLKMARL